MSGRLHGIHVLAEESAESAAKFPGPAACMADEKNIAAGERPYYNRPCIERLGYAGDEPRISTGGIGDEK